MGNHYGSTEVLFDGAVFLYTLATSKKKNWQVRISLPGRQGYLRKSLKTRSKHEAVAAASEEYLNLRARQAQNLPLKTYRWDDVWKEFREARKRLSEPFIGNNSRYYSLFFSKISDFSLIGDQDIIDYFDWRESFWTKASVTFQDHAPRVFTDHAPGGPEAESRFLTRILRSANSPSY